MTFETSTQSPRRSFQLSPPACAKIFGLLLAWGVLIWGVAAVAIFVVVVDTMLISFFWIC